MKLVPVDRRSNLTREEFIENYLKPKKPVIFTDLSKTWPATEKWTFDWLKENYGDLEVPLIDKNFHSTDKYFQISQRMPFKDYLELIETNKPLDLRLFLFDIFKKKPELKKDIHFPTIMDGFLKKYMYVFFGGKDSVSTLHYDMDCSNVFLTQFQTRKKVILFSPDQGTRLYKNPCTVMSNFDPENPDYEKFPAAKSLEGYEAVLTHGETIFLPSLWWHHIRYVDGGYSVALRANDSTYTFVAGALNFVRHALVDRLMTSVLGAKWNNWKEKIAAKRASALD